MGGRRGYGLGLLALAAAALAAAGPVSTAAGAALIGSPVTVGTQGNEPIVKQAPDGTLFISALQHLYVSRNHGATWTQAPATVFNGAANLASDSSIDVDPGGRLYFTFNYPYAGNVAVCLSDDDARSFTCNPAVLAGGNDRQWITAPSRDAAYLTTNEALYDTIFFTSSDRGATFVPRSHTDSLLNPNDGPLVRSPIDHDVYQPFVNNASNQSATDEELSGPLVIHAWDPTSPFTEHERSTPLLAGAALNDLAITPDGTFYLVSEGVSGKTASGTITGKNVLLARSSTRGLSWTVLPPLPGTSTGTAAFSWVAAGANGHVGVLYYYTPVGGRADSVNGTWSVKWAETYNAEAAQPTWTVQTVESNVHTGPICSTAGCTGSARFAGDFITAVFDSAGVPRLSYVRQATVNGQLVSQIRYAGR